VEGVGVNAGFWKKRRVLVTGHTGFKGSWLCIWLQMLGAEVTGCALEPPTEPSLFKVADVANGMDSGRADVRDLDAVTSIMRRSSPEIVIHMAAQAVVRKSYSDPVETYSTNVMGTVNVLEAVRSCDSVRAVLVVTSDKCYENKERMQGYREDEPMGGQDPYSSSKACAEILTAAWRHSFMKKAGVALASARAGNAIGGGDWAADRLVPDFLRSLDKGEPLRIRSPEAIRPWQHVLDPLSGYLRLAECLFTEGFAYAEGWNFGPADEDAKSVRWIVEHLVAAYPGVSWACEKESPLHEAQYLKLDASKARSRLGWKPRWRLETALNKTLEWHGAWRQGKDMPAVSIAQISEYTKWEP
jgi:CDP-glucose 4,6-dehydratase